MYELVEASEIPRDSARITPIPDGPNLLGYSLTTTGGFWESMVTERGTSPSDDVHRALAHADRRHLLAELARRDGPLDFADPEIPNVDDGSLQVRVKFRHLHLPLLEGYDFVAWDRAAAEVAPGERFEELQPWLESEKHSVVSP